MNEPTRTSIGEVRGHRGVAAVAVMPDRTQVIIMCDTMPELSRAFSALVPDGSLPIDEAKTRRAILISDRAFEP